jgi:integrase
MLELIDECRNDSLYLFAENGKPLSINALRMLMNRMGVGEYTPHGFRSSFRTWGAELEAFDSEVLEVALAHYANKSIVSTYRRTDFINERELILDEWQNYLER